MSAVGIFQFSDFTQYLRVACAQCVTRRNRPVTLDSLAMKLGYRSPRSIAMVMNGQRLPSAEMIERFSRYFELKENEHRYFELLIQLEKIKRKSGDPRAIIQELGRIRPGDAEPNIDADTFAYIADWHHFVIKQVIAANPDMTDIRLISKSLRANITEPEVRQSIKTMLDIGILERNENGLLSITKNHITTSQGIPDQAIRRHHKGMITRALESIDQEDFHNREITSITFRVDPENVVAAKKAIRHFRDEFHRQFESDSSKHVYQMNFQFFEHTKP